MSTFNLNSSPSSLVAYDGTLASSFGKVPWRPGRCNHSSVLLNTAAGPIYYVLGNCTTDDLYALEITKRQWKKLELVNHTSLQLGKLLGQSICLYDNKVCPSFTG